MTKIQAAHLPGLDLQTVPWQTLTFGEGVQRVDVSVPRLTPEQLQAFRERHSRAPAPETAATPAPAPQPAASYPPLETRR